MIWAGREGTAVEKHDFVTVLQSGGHSASSLVGQHSAFCRVPGRQLQMSSDGKELQVGTEYCRPQDLVTAGLLHKQGGNILSVFSAEVPEVHAYAVISRGIAHKQKDMGGLLQEDGRDLLIFHAGVHACAY